MARARQPPGPQLSVDAYPVGGFSHPDTGFQMPLPVYLKNWVSLPQAAGSPAETFPHAMSGAASGTGPGNFFSPALIVAAESLFNGIEFITLAVTRSSSQAISAKTFVMSATFAPYLMPS